MRLAPRSLETAMSDTPTISRLADGTFHLCLPGDDGHCFRIEASLDMRDWREISDHTIVDGALHFVDTDGDLFRWRFYRVIRIPCPEL